MSHVTYTHAHESCHKKNANESCRVSMSHVANINKKMQTSHFTYINANESCPNKK